MAARRPLLRMLAQCNARSQLNSQTASNHSRSCRRAASSFASRGSARSTLSPFATYLGVATLAVRLLTCASSQAVDNPLKLDATTLAERDQKTKREQGVTEASPMRLRMEKFVKEQQKQIVEALEEVDGTLFRTDEWQRKEGGGGITCVLQDGKVFEKAGVGVSIVYGTLPKPAIMKMRANHKNIVSDTEDIPDSLEFFAAGLSLIVHPKNPMCPTIHLNYRYFETANPNGDGSDSGAWWFGGGSDLTPSYLFDEDAIQFHKSLKEVCDAHDKDYYPRFKKWCDEYFYNKHRGESRGIGGIFFDDLDETVKDKESTFAFIQDALKSFVPNYIPIVKRRKDMPFTEKEKEWQQIRRGKYVEFNLVHDRGTAFGLNTPGARVESILMSLPLTASWKYMYEPEPKSREARLVEVLKNPKDSSPDGKLPTARELLTSLINTISEIPVLQQPVHLPEQQHDDSPSNALKLVPPSHRHLIVTLHVLFPGLLLPALDLLDRGLVQRIVVVVDDELFSGISTSKHSEPGAAGGEPKTRRGAANLKNRRGGSGNNSSFFYLVRSAAQLSSSAGGHRRHRSKSRDGQHGHGPGKTDAGGRMYMVRLGAWNCTCAAFAFAAFPPEPTPTTVIAQEQGQQQPPPGQQESSTKEGAVGEDRKVIQQEGVETETEMETEEKMEKGASEEEEWSFGGYTLDVNISGTAPPVCKHLLACLLADRWSAALGRYVVERRVSRVEMAGIVADI
ncbi:Coproporphyrinogen III oxidase [Diplogelasinospora grovesii]|uniref:coproporphyrinogen oxidase n=1 Tax=Diplogelasinospora grovesii TaxID=303347 RepID=A0AAN6S737_9PEZI|nr:Coproporphyrinogen III oxidase [Diplogelasinospora grovesii]